ncbi:MAG TPA: hypothetical protein VKQ06_01745 [Gammaproteobacteria bacterium]|nr:hypothetical protein [Gammaproteobacteria bacterium]
MRLTDDRYRNERGRFELAMRMILHEARTNTISFWTGLSDDRIRKVYDTYFRSPANAVRRRRGKSPTQIAPLIESPQRTLESGVLVYLLHRGGLFCSDGARQPPLRHNIELGQRFCDCYEAYRCVVPDPTLSFEWGWNLLMNIRSGDELGLRHCADCDTFHLTDLLAVPRSACPVCALVPAEAIRSLN